jgi:hypothetical protein
MQDVVRQSAPLLMLTPVQLLGTTTDAQTWLWLLCLSTIVTSFLFGWLGGKSTPKLFPSVPLHDVTMTDSEAIMHYELFFPHGEALLFSLFTIPFCGHLPCTVEIMKVRVSLHKS